MKKNFSFLLAAAVAAVLGGAEPLYEHFPNVFTAGTTARRSGVLKNGDTNFPAVIKGKSYPGTWAFWSVKGGNTPSDFVMEPLKFTRRGVNKGEFSTPGKGCFTDLNFAWLRNTGEGKGVAFSFRNPSKEKLDLELDGSLRLYSYDPQKPFQLYVFTVSSSGGKKVISTSAEKDNIFFTGKGKRKSYYFRLSADLTLEKDARVFIVLTDPELHRAPRNRNKIVFCLNEGLRKRAFVPCFILRSPIKK